MFTKRMKDVRAIYNESELLSGWLSENKGDFGMDNSEKIVSFGCSNFKDWEGFWKGRHYEAGRIRRQYECGDRSHRFFELDVALGLGGVPKEELLRSTDQSPVVRPP